MPRTPCRPWREFPAQVFSSPSPAQAAFVLLISLATSAAAQSTPPGVVIPAGTPLQVKLPQHRPSKKGPIQTQLVYPVYVGDTVALPAGTRVSGQVVRFEPNTSARRDAWLSADFTPYSKPVVQFDSATLPGGTPVSFSATPATDGSPLLYLAPRPASPRRAFVKQEFALLKAQLSDTARAITAPGRGDRLLQLLYHQLPWHPQRIEAGTSWVCELTSPLTLSAAAPHSGSSPSPAILPATGSEQQKFRLRTYLNQKINSASAKPGDSFTTTVAEPVRSADGSTIVPQGAMLLGVVTRARPAKSFARSGVLRFNFRQLELPGDTAQNVTASITGADSSATDNLQLDPEGGVSRRPHSHILVPLTMVFLASRPLSDDWSQEGGAAVGSNGLGLIGRVIGIASTSRDLAAGIGFYGTAVSVYRRWIRHGSDISFAKDTRIDVEISLRPGQELAK
jgi:hypothetical protein